MRLGFGGVFADAGALWRANRDLLLRVAAVFFFLPILALQLFVTPPKSGEDQAPEAVLAIAQDWLLANWHWLLGDALIEIFGGAVLLVLLLDPARPALDAALARAFRLLPAIVLAWLVSGAIVTIGLVAFLVPGCYFAGRTMLTGAVVVAEPAAGPFAAVVTGIRRTHGNGWVLFLTILAINIAMRLAAMTLLDIRVAMGALPGANLAVAIAIALVGMTGALALVLLQAAAYRLLSARQGI